MTFEQFVEVRIGNESYALPILEIYEIIRLQDIVELPKTRQYVRGVINLRGQIIPVISLRERLGLPEAENTKATRIVIVNHSEGVFGMIVDRVNQVISLTDIQVTPEQAGQIDSVVKGIGRKNEELVSVFNLETLLGETSSV